jgi:hypothetical protein
LLDTLLPGHVEGLYLVGSLALDDFQPGQSDVDFVAITPTPLQQDEIDRLAELHELLQSEYPDLRVDGIYVTQDDLARNPLELGPRPHHHEGEISVAPAFEANPAVWLTLRRHALPVLGPAQPDVRHDPEVLRSWTLDNLNSYWSGLVQQIRRFVEQRAKPLPNDAVFWCISGVPRLHYTLATGDVTSKSGACLYSLEAFPERFHPIIRTALAIRSGEADAAVDARDVHAFMEHVIEDANRRWTG